MPKLKSLRNMSIATINSTLKINKEGNDEENNATLFSSTKGAIGKSMKKKREDNNPIKAQAASKIKKSNHDGNEPSQKKIKVNKNSDDSDVDVPHAASSSHSLLSALHQIHTKSKSSSSAQAASSSNSLSPKKTSNAANNSAILFSAKNTRSYQSAPLSSVSVVSPAATKHAEKSPKQHQNHTTSDTDNAYVNNRTIYMEGLPFGSNEDEVKSFFQETCRSAHCSIVSVRLPTWHDSGRLKGYGHVEFSSAAGAQLAFELDGCDYLDTGRFVKIAPPKVPHAISSAAAATATAGSGSSEKKDTVGCRTVFVKNLPYDASEEEIREVFQVSD